MGGLRKVGWFGLGAIAIIATMVVALDQLDRAYPPPLSVGQTVSQEMRDADGQLLRAFATPDGRWRLKTTAADIDPLFIRMLVAYEDKRFHDHPGIDVLALGRAAFQLATNGRIVSGASTLSMQVARLMEPRQDRSLTAKARQMLRALQIERRLSKAEILDLYLTLAPYGGNIEGIRAASLAYFGKEPKRLGIDEAALLVALPQLPERRRPDRFPEAATEARKRVLDRMAAAEIVGKDETARAMMAAVPRSRKNLPALAAHMADAARRKAPQETVYRTTLRKSVQQGLESAASEAAAKLDPKVSVALVMADASTGEILGEVGSAGFFDTSRAGFVDMTRANRSPGSTLKPFIYGLAFEEGLVSQETVIEDRPADFSGYRPKNFDLTYQGDVSVREALQLSLNVPAVQLLEAVGPIKLLSRFRRADVRPILPTGEAPGLAIGLGGVGITLKDLVQIYAAIANRGRPVHLGDGIIEQADVIDGAPLLSPVAAWHVADILSAIRPPPGIAARPIAYKTGTSYGNRDAWSVGYDGRYVLGVWIGRADNGAVPGLTGYSHAAPLLFSAFNSSGVASVPFPAPPPGAVRIAQSQLPPSLKRFAVDGYGLTAISAREKPPQIVYPPEGARVELGTSADGTPLPLVLKMQGGRAPFRWLANGRPLEAVSRNRTSQWMPDGAGYATLTVIDAIGRAASVAVFLK